MREDRKLLPRICLLRFGHIATVALSRRVAACPKLLRKVKRCAKRPEGCTIHSAGVRVASWQFLAASTIAARSRTRPSIHPAAFAPQASGGRSIGRCFGAAGFLKEPCRPLVAVRVFGACTFPRSDVRSKRRALLVQPLGAAGHIDSRQGVSMCR